MNDVQGTHWIIYASKLSYDDFQDLKLTTEQIIALGQAISMNKLLNPPKVRSPKTATFSCKRCGQIFMDVYVTKKPTRCQKCK